MSALTTTRKSLMKRVQPFGDRILVRKKKVKDVKQKADSIIIMPDIVEERPTDLAIIVSMPELSLADEKLIEKAEVIIGSLAENASNGDSEALIALLRFKTFCSIKSLKVGDEIMIGKYVGTTFQDTNSDEPLTMVLESDIIGLVIND